MVAMRSHADLPSLMSSCEGRDGRGWHSVTYLLACLLTGVQGGTDVKAKMHFILHQAAALPDTVTAT